jgi:hypothetical protein
LFALGHLLRLWVFVTAGCLTHRSRGCDRCIDTSVCFPHPVLGRKFGLKALAERNLHLRIQTMGADGHVSTVALPN